MICCCLSGLCPLCVKYVIKCKLFTFELTRDWVNSKVVKSEFYSWKKSKRRGMCGKFIISSLKFHVNCFSMVLDAAVRLRDKMQVVYKEMVCDGAKSNVV